jgi:hypothetical protein
LWHRWKAWIFAARDLVRLGGLPMVRYRRGDHRCAILLPTAMEVPEVQEALEALVLWVLRVVLLGHTVKAQVPRTILAPIQDGALLLLTSRDTARTAAILPRRTSALPLGA